jgi:Matrixin
MSTVRRALSLSILCLTLPTVLQLLCQPAMADTKLSGVNTYSTNLPLYVDGPTKFDVTVRGANRDNVCGMTFQNRKLTVAPWHFTYTPSEFAFDKTVWVDLCADDTTRGETTDSEPFDLNVSQPYSLRSGLVNVPWMDSRSAIFPIYNYGKQGLSTVSIFNSKGKFLKRQTLTNNASTNIQIGFQGRTAVTTYRVVIKHSSGFSISRTILVPNHWSTLGVNGNRTFKTCSTIRWIYLNGGHPKSAADDGVLADIRGAFKRLSKQTGLKFVQSTDRTTNKANNSIRIFWFDFPKWDTNSADGGSESSSDGNDMRTWGSIRLNKHNRWAANNAYQGFVRPSHGAHFFNAGRGWLLVHEAMHVLGFGHVYNRMQVMSPTVTTNQFGRGDLLGLHYLYRPQLCHPRN